MDLDHGTYPFVTSSNTTAGSAATGTGIGPTQITDVVGVVKAYTTRVGEGPLPSAFEPEMDEHLRKLGGEFGATTVRPRRCGWFDSLLARMASQLNGLTGIAVTKLDVFDTLTELTRGRWAGWSRSTRPWTGLPRPHRGAHRRAGPVDLGGHEAEPDHPRGIGIERPSW